MRDLVATLLAVLSTPLAAHAEPQTRGRLTWIISSAGAGRVDDVTGPLVGWSMEPSIVHRNMQLGIELGISWVCPLSFESCDRSTFDMTLGLHARHRLARSSRGRPWWLGGGISAHRLERQVERDVSKMTHVDAESATAVWQPGVDLQLVYELGLERWFGVHVGLRGFAIRRGDPTTIAKPIAESPTVYGVDGGVVLELGYIYGR